jgi:hypothetical protein
MLMCNLEDGYMSVLCGLVVLARVLTFSLQCPRTSWGCLCEKSECELRHCSSEGLGLRVVSGIGGYVQNERGELLIFFPIFKRLSR